MTKNKALEGLYLFKALIKDGATWEGDTLSLAWSECLHYSEDTKDSVLKTLELYKEDEGTLYKHTPGRVWVY